VSTVTATNSTFYFKTVVKSVQ